MNEYDYVFVFVFVFVFVCVGGAVLCFVLLFGASFLLRPFC